MNGVATPEQEFAVRNLLAAYAHALDDRDLDGCAALFHADATLQFGGKLYTSRPEIRTWMDTLLAGAPGCHLTTNTRVWIDDGGVRSASDFGLIKQRDGGWIVLARGRYADTFDEGPDGTTFATRVIDFS